MVDHKKNFREHLLPKLLRKDPRENPGHQRLCLLPDLGTLWNPPGKARGSGQEKRNLGIIKH